MEKSHRNLIKYYLPRLLKYTYNLVPVVNKLYETKVINEWMKNYILDSSLSQTLNAERLYQVIQGRGPDAYSALTKTLLETGHIGAYKLLSVNKFIHEDDEITNEMRNSNLNESELYVKIHPNLQRMDVIENGISPDEVYHMGSNPKGHAFILNINKTIGKDERYGSDVDLESLNKLFEGLGYIVKSKVDLTKKQTIEAVEEFMDCCSRTKIDSIVVFIMSHGKAGKESTRSSDIFTSDGENINTDWLIEQFGSVKISKSIPKLFFIQACRGQNRDHGCVPIDIIGNNNVLQNDTTSFSTNSGNNSSVGNIFNRRYENIFIAYATVPGYNAKRHPVTGSWFVQTLCEIIRNNAWEHELQTMMGMVDRKVETLNCSVNGFQTIEWSYRGFNRKFFFNPGLYDDCTNVNISNNTQVKSVDT